MICRSVGLTLDHAQWSDTAVIGFSLLRTPRRTREQKSRVHAYKENRGTGDTELDEARLLFSMSERVGFAGGLHGRN